MNSADFLAERLSQRELCAITLLEEYIQFNFDGPVFNFYERPRLRFDERWVGPTELDYFDHVQKLLGSKVISVEEIPDILLNFDFENGRSVQLSLKPEDRSSAEAAMFQAGGGNGWMVW